MTETRVVNRYKEPYTLYIGRSQSAMHYGNPFSIGKSKISALEVGTRREAIHSFHDWLVGSAHQDIEPQRRQWVLENLESLRGNTIGCVCKPKCCHGDIYRVLLNEITLDSVYESLDEPVIAAKHKQAMTENDAQISLF